MDHLDKLALAKISKKLAKYFKTEKAADSWIENKLAELSHQPVTKLVSKGLMKTFEEEVEKLIASQQKLDISNASKYSN